MFRKEFIEIVTDTGMVTLKSLRPLTLDKRPEVISELDLIKFPNFDEVKFAQLCSVKYRLTFIDLSNAKVPSNVLSLLKKSIAIKYRVVPIQKTEKALTVAVYDPSIKQIQSELRQAIKHPVEIILTTISAWKKLFDNITESLDDLVDSVQEVKTESTAEGGGELKAEDIGQDVITFVNKLLAEAFIKKASDIHVEPYEKRFRIRFRIDGQLLEVSSPPKALMLPVVSRIKIMSQMDISERRKPQDGRIKLLIGGKSVDYRVSSLPTLWGEKVVLRLLDKSNLQLDMTKLGFEQKQLLSFLESIKAPHGVCLVTGPTGSGKTTTLYSALTELNKVNKNIATAEDPVEYNLEGINQVNVKQDIGFTFAEALRSFLRQDPDIIMVGEIRDRETAEIAIEAALTGHLVLSTLHTNDAPSTVSRLLNMDIEPFLVSAAVRCVVAQRLLRKICENCKVKDEVPIDHLVKCGIAPSSAQKIKTMKGKGCEACNNTGYKGRVAIYEVFVITPKIRDLILKGASTDEVKKMAIKEGMKTLRMCALTKVALGLTTLEEAVSVTHSDNI